MGSAFCVGALEEAMDRNGKPEIFNSDQGSQFTSFDFTQKLKAAGIRISMDGKGRWLDNVFVERLWRECVYLHAWTGAVKPGTGSVPGWPSITSGAHMPPMMVRHPTPPITPPRHLAASRDSGVR